MARVFEDDQCFITFGKENTMKLLLIVGSANDIFIYNYAKWLKASMDVSIDVFELSPSDQQRYSNEFYDNVISAKGCGIPKIRVFIDAFLKSWQLTRFIRGKEYDIIHCHWITPPIVITKELKEHCSKLVVSFWGGEFESQKILYSRKLYRLFLNRLTKQVDCVINESDSKQYILNNIPLYKGSYKTAVLGSAPLEFLYGIIKNETRIESKEQLGFPKDKISVLIGYSGKTIHRHQQIIDALKQRPALKQIIHLIAPMTRGANDNYIELVENELSKSGYSFSLIKGKFLSDEEIGRLRNATDIVLQLSDFDAFSRSIIECLCAKSIMIYGDWLGYEKYLKPSGFNAISVVSISEGIKVLSSIVNDLDAYKEMVESNFERGKRQYIWPECIKDWVNAYNDLIK